MDGGDDPDRLWGAVWTATGHTDMRRGMNSLALLVQEAFKRDPHAGAGREVRQSSAAQSAERGICARGDRAVGVDHGRSCRRLHVFAAERIHGDDITVPVLAKVKTRWRIWTYCP
jgi:hypothetical protein